ncbi:MAG: alpha/beta hydrolase [Pseudomonadota bacterium]
MSDSSLSSRKNAGLTDATDGTGPVVVMLHGAPDHKESWRGVIDLLKADHQCIALDLPGMGHFGPVPEGYDFSPKAQANWFEAWRSETLGNTPFTLLTHDIGAIMGACWAAYHAGPEQRLIVSNTVLSADHAWVGITKVWASPILGPLFMATLNGPAFRFAFGRDFPAVKPEQIRAMYAGLTRDARRSLLAFYRRLTRPDFFEVAQDALADLASRVDLTTVWGQDDALIEPDQADQIGGRIIRLEGCGHWVPLERPDVFAALVRGTFDQP